MKICFVVENSQIDSILLAFTVVFAYIWLDRIIGKTDDDRCVVCVDAGGIACEHALLMGIFCIVRFILL